MYMDTPKITVLLSVYNSAKYLAEAMESILSQTFSEFEFLIIDDASTDETEDIIHSYRDPRIRLLRNKSNIGLNRSLNIGLKEASGEYVARMDADDISEPKRLELQWDYVQAHPECALLGCQYHTIDEEGNILRAWVFPTDHPDIVAGLKRCNCLCHGSVLMHRARILSIGSYRNEIPYAQDYDLWIRTAENYQVANLPDYLYRLRMHEKAITSQKHYEQAVCVEFIRDLAEERSRHGRDILQDPEKREKALADLQQRLEDQERKIQHYILTVEQMRRYIDKLEAHNSHLEKLISGHPASRKAPGPSSEPKYTIRELSYQRKKTWGIFLLRLALRWFPPLRIALRRKIIACLDSFDGNFITGWAFALDGADITGVVKANGLEIGRLMLGDSRPDVAAAYPGFSKACTSGFTCWLDWSKAASSTVDLNIELRHAHGKGRILGLMRVEKPSMGAEKTELHHN